MSEKIQCFSIHENCKSVMSTRIPEISSISRPKNLLTTAAARCHQHPFVYAELKITSKVLKQCFMRACNVIRAGKNLRIFKKDFRFLGFLGFNLLTGARGTLDTRGL